MSTKYEFLEFVLNWSEGKARAITERDVAMLKEMVACLDPFPDELCEDIGVPSGCTFGAVARQIRDVLEDWTTG